MVLVVSVRFDGFNGFFMNSAAKTMVIFKIRMIMITIILMKRIAILTIKILSIPYKILQNEVDKNVGKN